LKSFILVRDVLEAQQIHGSDPFVVHRGNFLDVYGENTGSDLDLVFYLHPDLPLCLLYKFIEDYEGSVIVYSSHANDLVFLARFSSITSTATHERGDLPPTSAWSKNFYEVRRLVRPPA